MSEESSEFKPLPRKNNRRRKARGVGSTTPSTPRRTSSARATAARTGAAAPVSRKTRRRRAKKASPFGLLKWVGLAMIAGVAVFVFMSLRAAPAVPPPPAQELTPDPNATIVPTSAPLFPLPIQLPQFPTPEPTRVPTPTTPEVAIVAGHWAQESDDGVPTVPDSGAVCADGLREVEITKSVSDKVVDIMQGRGYHTVLLQEFDPRYVQEPKFKPKVYLSIHADSCLTGAEYAYATGYKIAHAEPSDNQQEDARLVTCLTDTYDEVATIYNKPFNANTITRDMTEYHGFRKIDPTTPAAIIELGFLGWDREFLVDHQDEMARALAIGLVEFLKGSSCLPPTATPEPTETVLP
jgi:N-acetylmuramoyl-L-alanine amidase